MRNTHFTGTTTNDSYSKEQYNVATATANAATLNKLNGKVISSVANLAAGATNTLTLANSLVKTTSEVQASVAYEGDGLPMLLSVTPKVGEIVFKVSNIDDTDALESAYTISYIVTNI